MGEPRAGTPERQTATGRRSLLVVGAGLVAAVTCALTLWAAGAIDPVPLPGIPVPSAEVTWLVPALQLLNDAAAVVTVGCLLGAAVLVPGGPTISTAGYRWLRMTTWSAAVWALAALVSLPLLLADFLGTGVEVVSLRAVYSFVVDIEQGRVLLVVAALAAVVASSARTVLTPTGARVLLVIALAATVPPAFTSHSADEADHDLAVAGLALHVLGVVGWAGGLLALLLAARLTGPTRTAAVGRFSRLAAPLALLVAGSGVVTSFTRLSAPGQLVNTSYGIVLLVKTAALLAVVTIGWWHRRRTLSALGAGRPGAFFRLAAVEVLLLAATIGVGVGLSRTAPPPVPQPAERAVEGASGVLPTPPPGTVGVFERE
ncbi:CopD family protein [Modestobacter sp. VKM Ac-2983]|uniref:copper resistance D family protein n=1 Tax=Modestobacter sp. VKM Ac-2983 TaxID=3004137 RepID=UPI0022AB9F3B|nr:CopD family protein [Modestobacter sp. VKM Ac-2983]MCZ2806962.1 CopD family protein [Modestobacter sp. VKM Ac-2983]